MDRFNFCKLKMYESEIKFHDRFREDVWSIKDEIKNLFDNGKSINCRGEKCQYCFLNLFCSDAVKLKNRGALDSKITPACIDNNKYFDGSSKYILTSQSDALTFLDYFLNHRYFTKGENCHQCKISRKCEGMQCAYIQKHGFKSLKPIV